MILFDNLGLVSYIRHVGFTILALYFNTMTQQFDLPKGMLNAVCYVESSHNPKAIHKDDGTEDSIGECQLHLSTAKLLGFKGTSKELLNPKVNIYYAAKYLKRQLNRYGGNQVKAISAYNIGTYRETNPGVPINKVYVYKVYRSWIKNK